MGKNWLCSAMTITVAAVPLEYNQAGVHSHKRPEIDPAKNALKSSFGPHFSPKGLDVAERALIKFQLA
jgi:hypothetical protein